MNSGYIVKGPGWLVAPLPENEEERIKTLWGCNILDTAPEETFDAVTRQAARHFKVPMATVSLVDTSRQWFKSTVGMDSRETPREQAFCAHAILDDNVMIVLDALEDLRFKGNPLVTGEPFVRFYAGAPLVAPNGMKLGAFCVIDTKPREGFSFKDRDYLKLMAAETVVEIYKHRRATK